MLPEDALQLLPDEDEKVRCADFAESIALDPAGTAISAGLIVLVETPLPWPKPVFEHPALVGVPGTFESAFGPARTLACVPAVEGGATAVEGDADAGPPDERGRVFTYWRDGATTHGRVHNPEDLAGFFATLETTSPADLSDEPAPESAILICTQGSHDICCGSEGTKLARQADLLLPDITTFRVSHTGGHRFSPTAMTLPDGRMWASLDIKALDGIVRQTYDPKMIAVLCRGWWGADRGPAQVAERAAFAIEGWSIGDHPHSVDIVDSGDDWWTVEVTTARAVYRADVQVGRVVPTIACRAAGGLPAKPGTEYALTGFAIG